MKLYTLVALAALASTPVFAQELEPTRVYPTQLYCYSIQDLMELSLAYNEKPLFVGIANIDGLNDDGDPVTMQGFMLFLVNQETGTWANYIFSPTGEACTLALGGSFEPYSE